MRADEIDAKVGEIIERGGLTASAELRGRALQAMEGCRAARGLPRLRWVAVGASVTAALVALLVWRQSPATALAEIKAATSKVRSAHMVVWRSGAGAHHTRTSAWYADGKWRIEEKDGTVQVYDGRHMHGYFPDENVFIKNMSDQPFGTPFRGFTIEALEKGVRGASVSVDREATWKDRPAWRMTIEQPQFRERAVVWADPQSHLPLAFEFYGHVGSERKPMGGSEVIEYNIPVPESTFAFNPPKGARVIDNATLERDWLARYKKGIATQTALGVNVILRDFQVCRDGEVFAIYSAGKQRTAWLYDDLHTVYVPGAYGFQPGAEGGASFTPLRPLSKRPSRYVFKLSIRKSPAMREFVTFTVTRPFYSPLIYPLYPDEARNSRFLCPQTSYILTGRLESRAWYWEQAGNLKAALEQYEAMTNEADRLWGRCGVGPYRWLKIGGLYEKVGDPDKAREAYRRGIECDRGNRWEKWWVEQLRKALSRLEAGGG